MQAGDSLEVAAERLDADGCGVGARGGVTIHVLGLLPGERGSAVIEHTSPHRPEAWGRLLERAGPAAPERVAPACPAFGRCGGCAWQHWAYPAQLAEKQRLVREALPDARVDDVVASPGETRHRNLGKYVVGAGTLGAYEPRSHRLVSTLGCAMVEPVIDRVAHALAARLPGCGLEAYDEPTRTGALRYALVRSDGERALVGLVTTSSAPAAPLRALADGLRRDVAAVAGVVQVVNDEQGGALLGRDQRTLCGDATIRQRVGPVEVEVGVGAFFQVNRAQAARMYAFVAEATGAGPGTAAVDVYCGVGGIALTLAAAGAHALGIEHTPEAVAAARAAAGRQRLPARFEVARAGELGRLAERADVVVVNPPRKGLDAATRHALLDLLPATVAYVSCNPATLARDVGALRAAGYRVERARAFDLMPGTAQVEVIAVLRRGQP
jgi:23S rRNA (uracil1939-C5)-methyltransferase